jgi:hypothetical protein
MGKPAGITRSRLELLSTSRVVDLRSNTQQQDASTRPVTARKVSSGRARLMGGLRVLTVDDELSALDDLARIVGRASQRNRSPHCLFWCRSVANSE